MTFLQGRQIFFQRDRIQVDFASNNLSITEKRSKGASNPHLSPILITARELSNFHHTGSTEQLKGREADEPCELTVKSGDGLLHGRCGRAVTMVAKMGAMPAECVKLLLLKTRTRIRYCGW